MERNFTNENLEEFLRQNADGLRMRPSDKVWKGISKHLNRRRRTLGFVFGTSLLLMVTVGYYLMNEPSYPVHPPVPNSALPTQKPLAGPSAKKPGLNAETSSPYQPSSNRKLALFSNTTTSTQQPARELPSPDVSIAQESENLYTPTVVDSYPGTVPAPETTAAEATAIIPADPLTIESVVNSYRPKARTGLSWQTYFTPTVSYRKLNDAYIDNVATHKPAFGFELGVAAKYPVTPNVKLRAGLQFNVNRYEIKTFDSYAQTATIRLNDGNRVDYVNTVTSYNNFSGYKSSWLKNFYLQVSAPVGLEFKIKGDDKVQFGVASTIQPTYLLGDRAYLISADYKNYAEMPKLVRRWNVNTDLQTFVAYSTGRLNWQVGPQVRYQILSSYLKKYPVKENLFDFGLKVGISVNKQ